MSADELRSQFRSSPEWAYVGLVNRIAALEAKVADLETKKRGTGKLQRTTNRNSKLSASK